MIELMQTVFSVIEISQLGKWYYVTYIMVGWNSNDLIDAKRGGVFNKMNLNWIWFSFNK